MIPDPLIQVELANRQSAHDVDSRKMIDVARAVLSGEGIQCAEVSLAVVDAPTMHQLNRQYLNHDYPTDVLSFPLTDAGDELFEGEVIVCADVAADVARRHDWQVLDELLLYVIHGTLHLAGYDDKSDAARAEMRKRESHYLQLHGINASNDEAVTLLRAASKDDLP